jgi:hypothetical protein
MKHYFFILVSAVLIFGTTVHGQTKVGATGISFVDTSPSVRANGMGEVGVVLADGYSAFFNPASITFQEDVDYARLTFLLKKANLHPAGIGLRYFSFSTNLLGSNAIFNQQFNLSIAYSRTSFCTEPIPVTTYDQPQGTGEFLRAENISNNLTVAAGISTKMNISFGGTVKWIREAYGATKGDGYAYDLGMLIGLPHTIDSSSVTFDDSKGMHLNPRFGMSICNLGADFEVMSDSIKRILPKLWRIGLMTEFRVIHTIAEIETDLLSVVPAAEIERQLIPDDDDNHRYKSGCEAGLAEAIYFRLGCIYSHDSMDRIVIENPWGVGIHSQGIARLIYSIFYPDKRQNPASVWKLLQTRLQVEFEFVRNSRKIKWLNPNPVYYNTDYYGISISL